jgi:DinB superfamily
MEPISKDVSRILGLLKNGPIRIGKTIQGVQQGRLYVRTDIEPWSINDILIHLRACSDVWGETVMAMLTEDNPVQRYKSPRAFMKKPKYQDQEFATALDSYALERQKLVTVLTHLDDAGWARPGTYTETTPRHRNQTVWSLTNRIVNHEQPHLEQIESLLR